MISLSLSLSLYSDTNMISNMDINMNGTSLSNTINISFPGGAGSGPEAAAQGPRPAPAGPFIIYIKI